MDLLMMKKLKKENINLSILYSEKNAQNNVKYSLSGKYNQKEMALFENGNKKTQEVKGTIPKPTLNTIMVLGANPRETYATGAYFKRYNIFRKNLQ